MLPHRQRAEVRHFFDRLDPAVRDGLYEVAVHSERLYELERAGDYADWELLSHGGRVGMFSLALNRLLSEHGYELPLETDAQAYELPPEARSAGRFLLENALAGGKILFNEQKVRLRTDICERTLTSGASLRLQPTDYFSGLITNDATLKQLRSRQRGLVFDGIRVVADENEQVWQLVESTASNHVGCSSLAVTADDRLVIVAQSGQAAQYASQLMPSASGSAAWDDLHGQATLGGFLRAAMERELAEECGIDPSLVVHTHLIGYQRQLDRGGKPEFYGVSFLDCAFDELDANVDVFTADIEGVDLAGAPLESLQEILEAFRDERQNSFSFSLYANLAFLEHHLADRPQIVAAWRR